MLPLFLHPRAKDAPFITLSVAAIMLAYISIPRLSSNADPQLLKS